MKDYKRLTKRAGWHKDIDLKDELGYSYIYQRLAELENAIEDGEIVRFHCKVGDTVYRITNPYRQEPKITSYIVTGFSINNKKAVYLLVRLKGNANLVNSMKIEDFIFNKEQAEKKLKEIIGE